MFNLGVGVQLFPGGGGGGGSNFFQGGGGGVQMLISIETHRTCDFPGGSRPSPLWICACYDLGPYCLQKRLPDQVAKVMTGE